MRFTHAFVVFVHHLHFSNTSIVIVCFVLFCVPFTKPYNCADQKIDCSRGGETCELKGLFVCVFVVLFSGANIPH